jgi:hypothetical protein
MAPRQDTERSLAVATPRTIVLTVLVLAAVIGAILAAINLFAEQSEGEHPGLVELDGLADLESKVDLAYLFSGIRAEPIEASKLGLEPRLVRTVPLMVGEVPSRPNRTGEHSRVQVSYYERGYEFDEFASYAGLRMLILYGAGRRERDTEVHATENNIAVVHKELSPTEQLEVVPFDAPGYELTAITDTAVPGSLTYLLEGQGRWFELTLRVQPADLGLPSADDVMAILRELALSEEG